MLTNETSFVSLHRVKYGYFTAIKKLFFLSIIQPNVRDKVAITVDSVERELTETTAISSIYQQNSLITFSDNDRLFFLDTSVFQGEIISVSIEVKQNADHSNICRISPPLFIGV